MAHKAIDFGVSVITDAGRDIKKRIIAWRKALSAFDYEFIIIARGTSHIRWLASQGDVQLIKIQDKRGLYRLICSMARNGNKLFFKNDEWKYRHIPIGVPVQLAINKKELPIPEPEEKAKPAQKSGARTVSFPVVDKLRILHVSNFPRNTRGITEGLKTFGVVDTFNWRKELDASDKEEMNVLLKWKTLAFRPHIIFMEECFTGDITPGTIRDIKHLMPVGIANWCGDILDYIPESLVAMGSVVDWSLMSNQPQVNELRESGINAEFLHAGAPVWLYKPSKPDRNRFPEDIIFLGSGGRDFPLSSLRKELVWLLHERYGSRFAVYGRGWRKKEYPFVKRYIEPEEDEAIAYSSCKITWGVSAFDYENYTSARMWKAMASGALYLPYYFTGIEKLFVQQKHVTWWRKPGELISFIDYYLQHDAERIQVAQAGLDIVKRNHSWTDRMETVIRLIKGRGIKIY